MESKQFESDKKESKDSLALFLINNGYTHREAKKASVIFREYMRNEINTKGILKIKGVGVLKISTYDSKLTPYGLLKPPYLKIKFFQSRLMTDKLNKESRKKWYKEYNSYEKERKEAIKAGKTWFMGFSKKDSGFERE